MRYASVCSGIEAATVAWHPLGWEPAVFCEIEKFPSAVLRHHYPHVPNHGDFTTLRGDEYGAIDLLVGGTPCQDFSVAGLRAGMAGQRGQLTVEFAQLAGRMRPRWLVWENVPGVLSIDGGRAFGEFLGILGKLGYGFAYRVLDAQHFGVPQRRRRVFVVGCLGDWRRAAAVLFERQSLSGDNPPRREKGKGFTHDVAPSLVSSGRGVERGSDTRGQDPVVAVGCGVDGGEVGFALRAGASHSGDKGDGGMNTTAVIVGTLSASGKAAGSATQQDAESGMLVTAPLTCNPYADNEGRESLLISHALRGEGFDASEDGTGRGTPLVPVAFDCKASGQCGFGVGEVASTMRSMGHAASHQNGGGHLAVAIGLDPQLNGDIEVVGALNTGSRSGGGQPARVGIGMAVRRLTPRECERLQGFPDDYTLFPGYNSKRIGDYGGNRGVADGPRYKALGNSMAVPVMRWIGEQIARVDAVREREA